MSLKKSHPRPHSARSLWPLNRWRNTRSVSLRLERLEARIAPANVTWDGGALTLNWADPANWSNDALPASGDDVTISLGGNSTITLSSADATVNSLACNQNLSVLAGKKLTVTDSFDLQNGRTLTADGAGSQFSAGGSTSADNASFFAKNGGTILLSGLISYTHSTDGTTNLQASGSNSLLDLSAMTTLTGPTGDQDGIAVRATNGGHVDLHNLATAVIGAGGFARNAITFQADLAGSLVDLSALSSFIDKCIFGTTGSALIAQTGGEVRAPLLTTLDNVGVQIDGAASVLPTDQYTSITNGFITLTGVGSARTLSALTTIDGSELTASAGAQIALPSVVAYHHFGDGTVTLKADGASSMLDLSAVTTMTGPTGDQDGITVRATNGGHVDLHKLATAAIGASGFARNAITFQADLAGSLVDLSSLAVFTDQSAFGTTGSALIAQTGGEVRAPLLTTLDNVGVQIDGATSLLPTDQYTNITNGFITLSGSGTARTLSALTDIDGTALTVSSGSQLHLPGVVAYHHFGDGTVTLKAEGAGSMLDLSAVTTLTGPTTDLDGITVRATNGGHVDLHALATAAIGTGSFARNGITFQADLAGSLVDLSALSSFTDKCSFGTTGSALIAQTGGEVRAPLLTTLNNVGLQIDGAACLLPTDQYTSITNGFITLSGAGNSRVLAGLLNINDSSVSVQSGASLRLPGITSYIADSGALSLEATGAGSQLDLPALASLSETAGTLTISLPSLSLATLTLSGGELRGAFGATISNTFDWTGGTIRTGGALQLLSGAIGKITGTAIKLLGRPLSNAGRLTYSGSNLLFGPSAEAGVLTNLAGATLNLVGDGDLTVFSANAGHALVNQGTMNRDGAGDTKVQVPFSNTGSIHISQGTLDIKSGGSLAFQGTSVLDSRPGASLNLNTSLGGTTTSAELFSPTGTTSLTGGSFGSPLQFEVMSRDEGASSAGLTNNFAFGTLSLNSAYVRLVNAADNATGSGDEVVYLDTLIVPAGSTLDLNGFKVYARAAKINGTILGGTVMLLPDGGPLGLNSPSSGTISNPGEADEWTFFGRAGQQFVAIGDPGVPGSPPPTDPVLGQLSVQVLGPTGAIVGTGASAAAGQSVKLTLNALTQNGTHRIRVQSAPSQPSATGNYRIAVYDATTVVRPLTLGQQVVGALTSPYSVDQWTFSASANQQVRLHLVGAHIAGLAFRLTGPNGFVGFTGVTGDSDPVTLPTAGTYVVEATTGGAGTGGYAFVLDAMSQTTLTLGTPHNGVLAGNGFAQLFKIIVPNANPLKIAFDSAATNNQTEIYAKLGAPPTRLSFDDHNEDIGADHEVLVPFAAPGTWYVLVYGASIPIPGAFTIQADSVPLRLTSASPNQSGTGQTTTLTVHGAGFLPGTQVDLVSSGGTVHAADSVVVDSISKVTATMNLLGVPAGTYDVRVTLPTGTSQSLPGAFEAIANGQPHLVTHLTLPSHLGRHAPGTLYLDYGNDGTAPMVAPILTVQSGDPDGSDRPLLTLDPSRLTIGLWTDAVPDGFANSIQIYASGATPGLLLPGEHVRVPIYYGALQLPWIFTDTQIEFEVRVHNAGSTEVIDWASIQAALKPDWMAADAWAAVVANLQANVGSTYGDYVRMLSANATYLAQLGESVTDVGQLYGFEVQQAVGLTPVRTIASATDATVPAPGLALSFGRSFGNTITERYQVGPFGRGWAASWQVALAQEADGTVIVRGSADSQRRFQPDRRSPGSYFSQAGDAGALKKVAGGAFELTESNGQVTRFRADGTLEYVQDTNGNRITTGFTGGRLTSLTHSSGASLTIAYNAAGLIQSITDSVGRVTTYGYDPTNTYLLTVTGPGGTTTYTYIPDVSGPKAFALASITDPSGVGRFFEYDARGRLSVTYLAGNAERVTYGYDAAGKATATDASGVSSSTFFDHRGLVVRTEDGTGAYVNYEYDADRHLSRETDALGRSREYTWCGCGSLLTATDEYGRVTALTKGGPNNQPLTFTDANGNVTRYGYDASGNLTSTTYADGSVERVAYDAVGNPIQLVNRRGQAIGRTFNAAGQLIGETFPDGPPTTYAYDPRGRLATATDASGTTTFTYDTADRLTRVDYPQARWLKYSYDAAARRTQMEDETGFVTVYVYDAAGRLKELRDAANALIDTYTYDAAGRLQREDKGNGTYTVYAYDTAGHVASIFNYAPDASVNSKFVYGYDTVGRRVSADTIDGTWTYTYDLSGQLTHAMFASINPLIPNQDLNYAYDALGNRTQTVLNGVMTVYTTNNLNQYRTAGTTTLQYDFDGNLISEAGPDGTKTYTYDSRNHLTQVLTPQGTWTNEYNEFGSRTAMVANGQRTEYLLDPFGLVNVVGEYDSSGARRNSYSYGQGLESVIGASQRGYYDFDAIGSTAGVSGGAGVYLNRYAYGPFGNSVLATPGAPISFQFVGQHGVMDDGNGLNYMRARYYSASTSRFDSIDPIRLSGLDTNLYRYAANSPLTDIDPRGTLVVIPKLPIIRSLLTGGPVRFNPFTVFLWNVLKPTELAPPELDEAPPEPPVTPPQAPWPGWPVEPEPPFPPYPNWPFGPPPPPPPPPPQLPPGDPPPNQPPVPVPTATDPNEKFGAIGFGPQAFIAADTVIPYRVNFENLGPGSMPAPAQPATAPAQRVEVTDQLSPNLDWGSLAFTEFGFGDTVVAVPDSRQSYSAVQLLTLNGKTFNVDVDLAFDPTTGLVRVVFESVDPLTALPPDVLTGFLIPEDGTGRGKGYFAYTVRARTGLPSGTEIRNVALISFDGQPVIATDQVDDHDPSQGTDPSRQALNTIDAGAPLARVLHLPEFSAGLSFPVRWAGQDEPYGSGVASYDVYVSDNGGAWILWQAGTTDTSANFTGQEYHTYRFFALARDHVGNTELANFEAEASTIATDGEFARGDVYGTDARHALVVQASAGVLANDVKKLGRIYCAQLVAGPTHGTLTLNPSGGFTYTPNGTFAGLDSFTYRTRDNTGRLGNVATVTLATQLVSFRVESQSVNEGAGAASIRVDLRQAATQTITVDYTVTARNATPGADFTLVNGTVTFAAGERNKAIPLAINNDALDEFDETFQVTLSNPANAVLGRSSTTLLTIVDNDAPPIIGFTKASVRSGEGVVAPVLEVRLNAATGKPVTVRYALSGGSAKNGTDFTLSGDTLTFAPGETLKLIPLTAINDALHEADETVMLVLSGAANARLGRTALKLRIIDDDAAPTVSFASGASSVGEGDGFANLTVSLSASSALPVTVRVLVTGGTATRDSDFRMLTWYLLTFAPGETTKSVQLAIIDDNVHEGNETALISLLNPMNATLGVAGSHTLTIFDND